MKYIVVQSKALEYYVEGFGHPRRTGDLALAYHITPEPQEHAGLDSCNATLFKLMGNGTPEQEQAVLQEVAKGFPGREVSLVNTVHIGVVPPGEYIAKQVSKDGVLPT